MRSTRNTLKNLTDSGRVKELHFSNNATSQHVTNYSKIISTRTYQMSTFLGKHYPIIIYLLQFTNPTTFTFSRETISG